MSLVSYHSLSEAFDIVFRRNLDKNALYYPDRGLYITYRELQELSCKIAIELKNQGCDLGDFVVIFNDKSPLGYASILACVDLGLIYTNLDPDSPLPRTFKILKKCSPKIIIDLSLAQENHEKIKDDYKITCLNSLESSPISTNISNKEIISTLPCYVMFTSGSTGFPKGAVVSHHNILSFVDWAHERFRIKSEDVFTNLNPLYFDNSVFDFFVALLAGACLVPFTTSQLKEPKKLIELLKISNCTIWFSVPSLIIYLLRLRILDEQSLPNIRTIIFGGEGFPKRPLKQLFNLYGDKAVFENVYGPTECTCICSSHTITQKDFDDMRSFAPLGKLGKNYKYYLDMQKDGNLGIGELILFGPNISLGYFSDNDRTDEVFVQHPLHNNFREIGYKTGDLVRLDKTNSFHFVSRKDYQIKHMGYRIELGEIESAINLCKNIKESAVVYFRIDDSLGEIRAYISGDKNLQVDDINKQLTSMLPSYMLPRSIDILEQMPKNSNGKIDRNLLANGMI